MNDLNKLKKLIPVEEHRQITLLVLLLLMGMGFEVLGIGALLPILTAILNPDFLLKNEQISILIEQFNISDHNQIVKIALASLLFVYVFKSIYLVYLSYFQNKFLSHLTVNLSNRLFKNYLTQNYSFHINRNSSELIKNIQVEINYFSNYLISIISLITEITLVFSVIITLFLLEPLPTIIVLTLFGFFSFLFYRMTKNITTKWGKIREEIDSKVSKIVLEGLSGIKEVILLGKQAYFHSQLVENNYSKAVMNSKALTLRQIPRYFLELLSVFSLIAFVAIMLIQNKDVDNVIVTLGVFVAATFRILPSINRILSALQNIKFYQTSIDVLIKEINPHKENLLSVEERRSILIPNKMIRVKDLSFGYSGTTKNVLNKVSFTIKTGSTIGIIGESGSGKSTLVNMIVGLFSPSSGEILIDGSSNIQDSLNAWQNAIGYVSQDVYLTDQSILSNVAFGVQEDSIDLDLIDKVLAQAQLTDLIASLPEGYHTKVGERGVQLSGGQKQRIGIARSLYTQPKILVLDEATSSLDVKTEEEIMVSVDKLKGEMIIIIVTHRLVTLRNCDEIFSIKKGKLSRENNIKIS